MLNKEIKFFPFTKPAELASKEPQPSLRLIPDWYKSIPPFSNKDKKLKFPINSGTHNSTLKKCMPFMDAMTAGYMVVLDDDIYIEQVDSKPFIRWKSSEEMITGHTQEQFENFPIPDQYHNLVLKWQNDFVIKTPKGFSALFTHPSNRIDLPFFTLSGFVDCDTYNQTVQFPFLLRKGFEGIITSGTPVAQMIPIKRESWKSKREKYNEEQIYKSTREFLRTFADSYKKNWWVKKEYN